MTTSLAKDINKQIGTAIDDLGMIGEIGLGIDHAEKLDGRLDAREVTQRRLGNGQKLKPCQARFEIGVLDGDIPPEPTDTIGPIRPLWTLSREIEKIAGEAKRYVIRNRRWHRRKAEAEAFKALLW